MTEPTDTKYGEFSMFQLAKISKKNNIKNLQKQHTKPIACEKERNLTINDRMKATTTKTATRREKYYVKLACDFLSSLTKKKKQTFA